MGERNGFPAGTPCWVDVTTTDLEGTKAFYATLSKANTYAISWRILEAKKPETRARRIAQFVTMLSKGEKLH